MDSISVREPAMAVVGLLLLGPVQDEAGEEGDAAVAVGVDAACEAEAGTASCKLEADALLSAISAESPAPCKATAIASSAALPVSLEEIAAAASATENVVLTLGAEVAESGSWHIQRSKCLYKDHSESTTRESLHGDSASEVSRHRQGLVKSTAGLH